MANFGVKVNVTADQSSKQKFNEQIQNMVSAIKVYKIDFAGDPTKLAKDIQEKIDKANFALKVDKIDVSSAVKNVKKELEGMLSALSVQSGVNIAGIKDFVSADGINKGVAKEAEAALSKLEKAKQVAVEYEAQVESIDRLKKATNNAINGVINKNAGTSDQVLQLTSQYDELNKKIIAFKSQQHALDDKTYQNLLREIEGVRDLASGYLQAAKASTKALNSEYINTQQAATLQKQAATMLKNNTSVAFSGKYGDELNKIITKLSGEVAITNKEFLEMKARLASINIEARQLGLTGKSAFDAMQNAYRKFGGWSIITHSLSAVMRGLRQIVTNVTELDSAMTELKKVTDETDVTYEKFLTNAATRAKSLGATLVDTVKATADFARLGYDLSEAASLADASLVYKNVGDGIESITTASESIISTMRAFNVEAEKSMTIVDKFNEVGNSFPITSYGIGEAMKRSAAAMTAANNTIDETIALITAMNSVVQDPERVGKVCPAA